MEDGLLVVELILDAADRLFLTGGFSETSMDEPTRDLGMNKKTLHRHFPGKRNLLSAVLDRQFAKVEKALAAAAEATAGASFERQVESFLVTAGGESSCIGAPQLSRERGDPILRPHVDQLVESVIYRRIDDLFRTGHRRGLPAAPPALLSVITRDALERLLTSQLPRDLDRKVRSACCATLSTS